VPEGSAKVTLFREASRESDLHERLVRGGKFLTGKFDPKLANILPDRTMMRSPESPGQRNGMHACELSHFRKSEGLVKSVVEKVSSLVQPTGSAILGDMGNLTRGTR